MPEQIHGHEVMKMMIDAGQVYTKDTLRAAMAERFGAGARFYTCSAENMTADELIANLERNCAGNFINLSVAPDAKSYTVTIPSNGHKQTYPTKQRR